jgi:CRP-like cAMP-binding protein
MRSSLAGLWGLSPAKAAALARHCTVLHAQRGERIARRGEPLPGVHVVASGTVTLAVTAAEGEQRVLRLVASGEPFGEPTALLGSPCLYDAYAVTDVTLIIVPRAAMLGLFERDRRFARQLLLAIAARSYTVLREFEAATTQRGAQRLAGYLGSLPGRESVSGVHTVDLPVSKTIVAARLGMKKETLSRLLHQFTADGIIGVARREIAILDRARLASVAGQGHGK